MELFFSDGGRLDVTRLSDNTRSFFQGIIDKIDFSSSVSTEDIKDGNSQYPLKRTNGQSAKLSITLNSFNQRFHSMATATTYAAAASAEMPHLQYFTIPATPFTVTLEHVPSASSVVIHDEDGTAYTVSYTTPPDGTGKAQVSTNTVVFAEADAGKKVAVRYTFAVDSHKTTASATAQHDQFKFVIIGKASKEDNQATKKNFALTLSRCVLDGDASLPSMTNSSNSPVTYTFSIDRPATGEDPWDLLVED